MSKFCTNCGTPVMGTFYNQSMSNNTNSTYNQGINNNIGSAYNQDMNNNVNQSYNQDMNNNMNQSYNQGMNNNMNQFYNQGMNNGYNQQVNNFTYNNNVNIQKREIVTAIILSLVTCGIYGIYWFICLTNDSNSVSNNEKTASGGVAFLLSLVTCGIYTFYWNYKLGKKLYEAGRNYGVDISDNSVLYLILSIFGLGIISYCLAQSDLNKFAK